MKVKAVTVVLMSDRPEKMIRETRPGTTAVSDAPEGHAGHAGAAITPWPATHSPAEALAKHCRVPIVQAALAAGLSWLVAVHIIGHRVPFFAPVAAVVCLGITLGQRLRRAIELIVGVGLGVGVGDLLISAIGTGPWQIALVVALAMSIAVLLDGGAVITVQAAVSAILVATLYLPGDTSGVDRLVDGLIGGATGLLVVGVFPRSPCPGPPSL